MRGCCIERTRVGRTGALVEAFTEFDIAGNIGGLLDECVQGFLPFQGGNQSVTNNPVKATEVVASNSDVGLV